MAKEIWKDLAGFNGWYSISSLGRVLSFCRRKPKILAQPLVRGYYVVRPYRLDSKSSKMVYVHKLVALTFLGKRPPNHQVNHINGIQTDNRAKNLEWSTHTENMRHAQTLPNANHGENCYLAKLTEHDVRRIRRMRKNGYAILALAKRFRVSLWTIWDILNKRSWKWLK